MDETTIKDIKQRAARWKKEYYARNGSESERTWIFSVNVDDVELLLKEIDFLEKERDDLQRFIEELQSRMNSTKIWIEFDKWRVANGR